MKRLVSIGFVLLFLCSIIVPVFATGTTDVQPRYTEINAVSADLEINALGIASCSGQVTAKHLNSVEVIVRLQKYTGTSWTTLKTWTSTGTATAYASGKYAVNSGYKYRVSVTGYVYDTDDTILETATARDEVEY